MGTIEKRAGAKPWRARWRDPSGRTQSKQFARKVDAEAFLTEVEHTKLTGAYVDQRAGRERFRPFAEQWLASQTFDESSREAVRSRLKVHILPTFGDVEIRAIKPSMIQQWLRGQQARCAPRYVEVQLAHLSAILSAAVEDGRIARNPCQSSAVRAPKAPREKIVAWAPETVRAIVDATPGEHRGIVMLAAGAGLRQGECLGLRACDVDFLGRRLHVRQQVKRTSGRGLHLALPKGQREREVPLADAVGVALAEHLRALPAEGDQLLFRTDDGGLIDRNRWNREVWTPAVEKAGVQGKRRGLHQLRHYFASVVLEGGGSIRALADYLGHSDPGFTLRTYAHMMPSSEDRVRQAVDAAFAGMADGGLALGSSG